MNAWGRIKRRWEAAGRAVERERNTALALGAIGHFNSLQDRCNICHTPWVSNGPGPADCACTLGR